MYSHEDAVYVGNVKYSMSQGYRVSKAVEGAGGVVWRRETVIFIGSGIRKSR